MKTTRFILLASATAFQILCFQNCSSNVKFGDLSSASIDGTGGANGEVNTVPTPVPTPTCETTFTEETGIVKIIFVVDASGSNRVGATTDIDKHWRTQAMTNFLDRYQDKSNFYYNITTFQGSSARSRINDSSNHAVFTNEPALIQSGINNFLNNTDDDGTPYQSALSAAQRTIENDLAANPATEINYSIVFLSDGSPSDYEGLGEKLGEGNPVIGTAELTADIQDVLAVFPEHISLNTVYYYKDGHISEPAQVIMQLMAQTGNGSYLMANSSDSIQIDDTIRIPHTTCH